MSKQIEFKTDNATYIFQHPGIRYVDEMSDKSLDKNNRNMPHRYNELMMENVIVSPAVNYAYFDKLEGDKKEVFEINGRKYEFVNPGAKTLSEMSYHFTDGEGKPSQVKVKEQFMKHIIKYDGEVVSYDFFDELGDIREFNTVIEKSTVFVQNTEFMRVMTACRQFLNGEEIEG